MIVANLKRTCLPWFILLLGIWIAHPLDLNASGLRNRCGTVEALQAARSAMAMRPVLSEERVSPSGRFKVHFATSGVDVPAAGFVDSTLSIMDQMYALEVESLGFKSPPTEDDGYYHVYLLDLDGYYGSTHPLGSIGTDVPSYIQCDNDFAESYYPTRGMNGLRVTLAHEFFHVIQFGYRVNLFQVQFYEWYSTWMEDVAYPLIDDYIWYLDGYFAEPQSSLLRSGDNREYAACVFVHFIHQTLGIEAIRIAWEEMEANSESTVYDAALVGIESVRERYPDQYQFLNQYAARYGMWFYATGSRSIDGFGFEDAEYYPEAVAMTVSSTDISWQGTLGPWGMKLIHIPNGVNDFINIGDGHGIDYLGMGAGAKTHSGEWTFIWDLDITNPIIGQPCFVAFTSIYPNAKTYTVEAIAANNDPGDDIVFKGLYPNPSAGAMSIEFDVDPSDEVEISIFNILGQLVWREYRVFNDSGPYAINWDGKSNNGIRMPNGTYFVRLKSGSKMAGKKFVRVQSAP